MAVYPCPSGGLGSSHAACALKAPRAGQVPRVVSLPARRDCVVQLPYGSCGFSRSEGCNLLETMTTRAHPRRGVSVLPSAWGTSAVYEVGRTRPSPHPCIANPLRGGHGTRPCNVRPDDPAEQPECASDNADAEPRHRTWNPQGPTPGFKLPARSDLSPLSRHHHLDDAPPNRRRTREHVRVPESHRQGGESRAPYGRSKNRGFGHPAGGPVFGHFWPSQTPPPEGGPEGVPGGRKVQKTRVTLNQDR